MLVLVVRIFCVRIVHWDALSIKSVVASNVVKVSVPQFQHFIFSSWGRFMIDQR